MFVAVARHGDCCRRRADLRVAETGPGFGANSSVCEAPCSAMPQCTHFSHSLRFLDCVYCRGCALQTKASSRHYSSWRKHNVSNGEDSAGAAPPPALTPDAAATSEYHGAKTLPVQWADSVGRDDVSWEARDVRPDWVQQMLAVAGLPQHWPAPSMEQGVLYGAVSRERRQPVRLPEGGCSATVSSRDTARDLHHASPLVEAAISASILRQRMAPRLPLALVTSPSAAAFVRAQEPIASLWDVLLEFDHASAARRLEGLREQSPEMVRMKRGSAPFFWKLFHVLLSPFRRTVYLDADILVLDRSLVISLLRRSLRVHEMAFPVDVARPGSLDPAWRAVRSPQGAANVVRKAPLGPRLASPKHLQPYNAPMFAKGAPPMCSCMMAFSRTPRVRRLLLHAAARLAAMVNPHDITNPALGIRQTDQEMLWFELNLGEPAQQPSTLLLPEEWYCPSTIGSRQFLDVVDRLEHSLYPWWGFMTNRFKNLHVVDSDRYVSGGVKECHALHAHYSFRLMSGWNLTRALPSTNVRWIVARMENELYCWQRASGNVTPACFVAESNLVFLETASTDRLPQRGEGGPRQGAVAACPWKDAKEFT
jgi:hypothetical protein